MPIFSEQTTAQDEVEYPPAVPAPSNAPEFRSDRLEADVSPAFSPPARANLLTAIRSKIGADVLLGLFFGIVLGIIATFLLYERPFSSREDATLHFFWKQLFDKDRDTFIVPSDGGLVVMQRIIDRPVPLTTYVNGSYKAPAKIGDAPNAAELLKLGSRRFTSVVDLDFVAHLAQLREVVPKRMMIRYARDLRMDDLRTGNAILIGSDEANPWLELFRPQLHFCFRFEPDLEKPSGFANLYPRPGEDTIYTTKGQEDRTYGIIAYLPNLTNTGHVVIVAGLNTAGTQAATAFLLDPSSIVPTLRRAKTARGDLQPFELLVKASNVATNASTPSVVLERIGLPEEH
jgi:hypothetical protein